MSNRPNTPWRERSARELHNGISALYGNLKDAVARGDSDAARQAYADILRSAEEIHRRECVTDDADLQISYVRRASEAQQFADSAAIPENWTVLRLRSSETHDVLMGRWPGQIERRDE